jgi:hypothetical protein
MKKLLAASLMMCVAVPSAQAEVVNNDTVLMLKAAGLPDAAIVAKIKEGDVDFDTSTAAIIALSGKGLSGEVIAAMLDRTAQDNKAEQPAISLTSPDPKVPHPSGLYILHGTGEARMQRIDATLSSQAKTGGILGYALTGGIASMSVKASIANESAKTVTADTRPVFYFFFDESNPSMMQAVSPWLGGATSAAASPNEFSLVELMAKKERREVRVGSMNIGGAKTGVMDKDRLAFDFEMVRQGVYRVQPSENLPAGEYAFLQAMTGSGTNGATTARIFDFKVQ